MNKYYQILGKVLEKGKTQTNKKGNIRYLLNEQLSLTPADLLDIFESHGIARKKLKNELQLNDTVMWASTGGTIAVLSW